MIVTVIVMSLRFPSTVHLVLVRPSLWFSLFLLYFNETVEVYNLYQFLYLVFECVTLFHCVSIVVMIMVVLSVVNFRRVWVLLLAKCVPHLVTSVSKQLIEYGGIWVN